MVFLNKKISVYWENINLTYKMANLFKLILKKTMSSYVR